MGTLSRLNHTINIYNNWLNLYSDILNMDKIVYIKLSNQLLERNKSKLLPFLYRLLNNKQVLIKLYNFYSFNQVYGKEIYGGFILYLKLLKNSQILTIHLIIIHYFIKLSKYLQHLYNH